MEEKKVQVSQDYLYEYLTGHDVKLTRIAELMDMGAANVSAYFLHHNDNNGRPRRFGHVHIDKLNAALPVIASELRDCMMTFGSPQVRTSQWGNTYDPALLLPMKRIGKYMNITSLTERLLGWSSSKKAARLVQKQSKSYGNISKEEMMKVNAELLGVAGVLDGVSVMYNNSSSSSSSSL